MMGARWDGSFDQNDELYTSSFETKEEKTAADLKVLKERIAEAIDIRIGRKLLNTWVDGTDSYLAENSYARYNKVYDYLIGDKSGFLTLYSQAFRALNMLAMGLCALLAFVRLKRHKEYPPLFLIQLTVLGCMAFHLIWETNPLYSISFTFLCLILLADGISSLRESPAMILVLKKSWIGCAAGFVLLAALLSLGKKELIDTPIEAWDYSVNQYQYAGGYDGYVTSYDQTYVQTFTTDKPFNRVSIQVINPVGPYNQSAFTVRITDENGNVIYDNDRFLSGLVDQLENSYEFVLDEIVPDGPTAYTLEITPGYIEGENSLEFLSYNTGNWDLYADGSLTSAGQEEEKGDLAFAVYDTRSPPISVSNSMQFSVQACFCSQPPSPSARGRCSGDREAYHEHRFSFRAARMQYVRIYPCFSFPAADSFHFHRAGWRPPAPAHILHNEPRRYTGLPALFHSERLPRLHPHSGSPR